MVFTDSHCHLHLLGLSPEEIISTLQAAKDQGVQHFLCVSVTLNDFKAMLRLVQSLPFAISVSVGLHPNENEGQLGATVDELVKLADHPKVVAIGETGLDYYRSVGDLAWQRERFRIHVRAALQAKKPLIVHTRNAAADTIQILTEEGAHEVGGVMHCFTEDWHTAKMAMELNFYISFSGIVTFNNAQSLQEVAQKVPIDRILIETDAPYLAPVPFRGKPNRPMYVRQVAEQIAKLRGIPLLDVATQTTHNFLQLFSGHTTI